MNVALIECDNCHSDVLIKTDDKHSEYVPAGRCYLCKITYVQAADKGKTVYVAVKDEA